MQRGDRIEVRVYGAVYVPAQVLREAGTDLDAVDDEGGLWSVDLADEGKEWRRPGGTGGVLITALYEAAHAVLEAWPRAWFGGGSQRAQNAYEGLRAALEEAGDLSSRATRLADGWRADA